MSYTSRPMNKETMKHTAHVHAQGLASSSEIHGTEVPGHLSSGADAARETALILLLLWVLLLNVISFDYLVTVLAVFAFGWVVWKTGRSAWLAWMRLERLHRILDQERWEIQHQRAEEREELVVLYRAKGLEGQLLEDVVDIFMADDNRLLRIMVEEELGLSVETYEHPLKQAAGALVGALAAAIVCIGSFVLFPSFGMIVSAFVIVSVGGALSAYYAGNRIIPATVWTIGIAGLSFGCVYFLGQFLGRFSL